MPDAPILVINTGSSSLKLGLYAERDGQEHLLFDGLADGIGRAAARLRSVVQTVKSSVRRPLPPRRNTKRCAKRSVACGALLRVPCAIGHRVVHGGPRLTTHQRITPEVLDAVAAVRALRAAAHPDGAAAYRGGAVGVSADSRVRLLRHRLPPHHAGGSVPLRAATQRSTNRAFAATASTASPTSRSSTSLGTTCPSGRSSPTSAAARAWLRCATAGPSIPRWASRRPAEFPWRPEPAT